MAYNQIILTDLHAPVSDQSEDQLAEEIRRNTTVLRAGGASGPFYGISGFQSQDNKEFPEVTPNAISLVYWGSPHWSHEHDNATKQFKDSGAFKTNSMESMAWLAKNAFVLETFNSCYKVEFYQPRYKKNASNGFTSRRSLIVAEGFFRQYKPCTSGVQLHVIAPEDDIMVAMLVPARFAQCVQWRDGQCDVGATMLSVIKTMGLSEKAVELGGHTFSLIYEIHLANLEQMEE